MFTGAYTALITPFTNNLIDEISLCQLVDFQCNQGIDGIIVCGTTGEFFNLTAQEHKNIIRIAVSQAAGRVPIIAGVGHFSTLETVKLAQQSQDSGANGLLIVTPPYIKPSGPALQHHYETIHNQTNLPIILYDNPNRGSVIIPDEQVIKLSKLPRIVGLKDAAGDLIRPARLVPYIPPDFSLLSGDDATTLAFMAQGGSGVISVTSNIVPNMIKQMLIDWREGNLQHAIKLNHQLLPLHQALFYEPSPAGIKYACAALKLCQDQVRLPLTPLSAQGRLLIDTILENLFINHSVQIKS